MNRRESLALAAGAAASLAGCSGFASSSSGTASESPTAGQPAADGPASGTAMAPEVILVRADTDRQPVWLADGDGEDDGRPTPRPDARHIDSVVVDSEARAGRLSVDPEADGARVASFLSETDFGDETVVVETIQVEECFRLELCRISWQPETLSTDYTRRSRHWDEPCAVDERVFESRLIRIPDALDADDVGARSTSIGTGACRPGGSGSRATGEGGSSRSMPDGTGSRIPTETGGER
jgi:hypothetical protein